MTLLLITRLLALVGLLFAVGALAWRWRRTVQRPLPVDRSLAKGSPQQGVTYAFTLGMAPWAKESTRIHRIAYLRGIAFHVGIFAGLVALLISPWWDLLPDLASWLLIALAGSGAIFGFAGEVMRRAEHNLRALSTADDHASVLLVSLFLTAVTVALIVPTWMPVMYAVGAVMLVYMPLGKIRHCIYFFFSRRFFGLFVGRRAVVHVEVTR